MKVVTVTPAGTIDLTYQVDSLRPGALIRAQSSIREVSGKGVNVAVALQTGGIQAAAVVVLGSDDVSLAAASPHADVLRPVLIPGQTRVSTQIVDSQGITTKVNAPTPRMTSLQWRDLISAVDAELTDDDVRWLVIGGSLPSVDGDAPAIRSLLAGASARGVRVIVDTSGDPLRRVLMKPAGITMVKPNVHELSEALGGISLRTVGDVITAAHAVIDRGIPLIYASMGPDGALIVSRDQVVLSLARAPHLGSTAGAGDASLAGFILGAGSGSQLDLIGACTMAARLGASAVAQEATLVTSLDALPEAVTTTAPDPARPLTEPAR